MSRYEILIFNLQQNDDMERIQQALTAAGIEDAGDIAAGAYRVYAKPRSVFVSPSEVQKAVTVLNDLGYETDEDENGD